MATQDQVHDMVCINVLVSATQLVDTLSKDTTYEDMALDIILRPDYETPARNAGYEVEQDGGKFYVLKTETTPSKLGKFDTIAQAWEFACDVESIEPYLYKAYEHWIVSDWLAHQLAARGELIEWDFMGLTIWGRCATGSAIELDEVMINICNNIN